MAQIEHCQDVETVTTEGFDGLFQGGSTPEPGQNQGGSTPEPGLTLKEAVEFYKISEKSVRIRIGQGKIPAIKVAGNNGPEWRIFPNGLPTPEPDRNQGDSSVEPDRNQSGSTVEAEPVEEPTRVEPTWCEAENVGAVDSAPLDQARNERVEELGQLLSIISSQAEKLEAANYRIGYLQSKVENQEEQIKLLTCSERSNSWWQSFCNWMLGRTPSSDGPR